LALSVKILKITRWILMKKKVNLIMLIKCKGPKTLHLARISAKVLLKARLNEIQIFRPKELTSARQICLFQGEILR